MRTLTTKVLYEKAILERSSDSLKLDRFRKHLELEFNAILRRYVKTPPNNIKVVLYM